MKESGRIDPTMRSFLARTIPTKAKSEMTTKNKTLRSMIFNCKTDTGVQSKLSFIQKLNKIAKLNLSYRNNCETRFFFIARPEKRCDEAENHSRMFSEK